MRNWLCFFPFGSCTPQSTSNKRHFCENGQDMCKYVLYTLCIELSVNYEYCRWKWLNEDDFGPDKQEMRMDSKKSHHLCHYRLRNISKFNGCSQFNIFCGQRWNYWNEEFVLSHEVRVCIEQSRATVAFTKFFLSTKLVIDAIWFSLPWNQQTVIGWFGSVVVSAVCAITTFPISGFFLSFFISFYEYHKAFLTTLEDLAKTLDQYIETRDRPAMKSVLCDLQGYNIVGKE